MILDSPPYRLIPEPSAPPLPGRRKSFTDPNFGTPLVQLTDETDGTLCRISYGIWSAFSCDYTKILIECDGLFKIVTWDPVTMDNWGDIALPPSFQGSDAIWSHTDPDLIYHRDGGSRLMLLNVATGADIAVWDAGGFFSDSPYLTRMSASADDKVFCFARQTTGYKFSGFCVYRIGFGVIFREPPSRAGQYFKVQIDKSGRFVWNVSTDPWSEWWDLEMPNGQKTILTPGTGHSAMLTCRTVQYDNSANVDNFRTLSFPATLMFGAPIKWPDWDLATEYSGSDADEKWYAVTTGTLVPIGPLHDELLQVSTDGSGSVRRICHLHNVLVSGNYDTIPQPACGYGAHPLIAFHSSWGPRGRRDVFIARTGKSAQMPDITTWLRPPADPLVAPLPAPQL